MDLGISDEIADRFAEKAREGGFTTRFPSGVEPVSGYSVSPYPERSLVIPTNEFRAGDLRLYADKNADLLSQPHHHLGAWREKTPEGDRIWLDVSVVEESAEEAFKVADQANQIAVYDLALGEVLDAGGTGAVRSAPRKESLQRWTLPEGADSEMLRIFFASLVSRH